MSLLAYINNLKEGDKSEAVKRLITSSTPDFAFFLMVTLAMLMATLGLITNNIAVIIGSMLIAPILSPILSLSLGMVLSDFKLIKRSVYTILKSAIIGIGAAAVATTFFHSGDLNSEIISRTEPSLLYFFIALIAGFAVSYSTVNPNLSETLPGIAIAVALIPPLSVIGIGIAKLDWEVISGSSILFLINVVGIVFASMVSFSLMSFYRKRKIADTTIKKEEKRLKVEKKEAEKFEEKTQI